MARVTLEVAGRRYEVGCRDGEEHRLAMLGRLVAARAEEVTGAVGRGSEGRELLLTALLLADGLDEALGREAAAAAAQDQTAAALERCADRLEQLAAAAEADIAGGPATS